jgi:hypothetical protein
VFLAVISLSQSLGQGSALLYVAPPSKVAASRSAGAEAKLSVQLQAGYHVNSNTPAENYLIPLKLTWQPGALVAPEILYPKPRTEKYEFSEKPLSVYTGDFQIVTRFKVDPKAATGPGVLAGKLRYQACSDTTCFPPKTVEIHLPYDIK